MHVNRDKTSLLFSSLENEKNVVPVRRGCSIWPGLMALLIAKLDPALVGETKVAVCRQTRR
jgi:hypothetical protein